jgi:predicted enzyme related to lactoylglutathione lyase
MHITKARVVGVELYFEDLENATRFYHDVLGLEVAEDDAARYTKLATEGAFICLERKGVESYPSRDKAVVFLEVSDLRATVAAIGPDRFLQHEQGGDGRVPWAVLHDPEGHNVILLQAKPAANIPAPVKLDTLT